MRALLLILTTLCVLAAAGMGVLASSNGFGEDAEKASAMVDSLEKSMGADAKPVKELRAVVDGYKMSSIGALVVAGLSVLFLILTFIKKPQPQMIVGLAIIGAAVAFILLSPGLDVPGGKADPRTQAMMFGIPGALAAIFGILAEKKRQA